MRNCYVYKVRKKLYCCHTSFVQDALFVLSLNQQLILLPLLDINVYCSFWSSAFFNSASFVSYYFPQRLKFMADFCFDFFYFLAQVAIYFLVLCVLICSQHWSMVISIPNKEDESQPILLYLDSLGLQPSKCIFENIRR